MTCAQGRDVSKHSRGWADERLPGAGRCVFAWDARELVPRHVGPWHQERQTRLRRVGDKGPVLEGRLLDRDGHSDEQRGSDVDVPEVAAPRKLSVEHGAALCTRRVAVWELFDLDTVDQDATMEVVANASSIAISRLVTGVTVTGSGQRLTVDETGDNAALTTDFVVVTGPALEVYIASTTTVSVGVLGGNFTTAPDGSATMRQARKTDTLVGDDPAPAINVTVGTVEEAAHVTFGGAARIDGATENVGVVLDSSVAVRVGHLAGQVAVSGHADVRSLRVPRRPSSPSRAGVRRFVAAMDGSVSVAVGGVFIMGAPLLMKASSVPEAPKTNPAKSPKTTDAPALHAVIGLASCRTNGAPPRGVPAPA